MTICLVDTSIFCNVLEVPGRCQDKDAALAGLKEKIEANWSLLLPVAAIVETGNHIAQVADGRLRRGVAERFVGQGKMALNGEAPWVVTPLPEKEAWLAWLSEFPDHAMREVGMGDLTIIKEFERQCTLLSMRRVLVWSLDGDLDGYDRKSG